MNTCCRCKKETKHNYCNACVRARRIEKKGITVEDFQKLLNESQGKCGICNLRTKKGAKGYNPIPYDIPNKGFVLLCKGCHSRIKLLLKFLE